MRIPIMAKSQKEIILTMRRALCSYTQIAEKTGLSVGAIKSYCYRNGLNTESLKSSSGFCKNCGKPILTPSKTRPRRFCSDACKTAWWNLHRYDHKNSSLIKPFKCNICGKEFADYSSTQRKYCSRLCKSIKRKGRYATFPFSAGQLLQQSYSGA